MKFSLGISNFLEETSIQKKKEKERKRKGLNDPDNHDGVVTHLEPDILECKVKGALGSTTMNKASGGNGISAELF